ncbi:MAG TPA: flagellar motor switch phosphatase FliY [Bacillota bacterium]|nr:flagellar motor switch phosphatase FliY [Bacillota bacterium]
MSNKLLKQEEIDALLSQSAEGGQRAEEGAVLLEGSEQGKTAAAEDAVTESWQPEDGGLEAAGDAVREPDAAGEKEVVSMEMEHLLKDEEKDALGEIGNICMGSAATTLSMLLNHKVSITSPRVTITTMDELFHSFVVPHMCIYVRFIEGLSGYNLLIMRLPDAAVLADLIMGGEGKDVPEEISEIGVSAASEAMNQMIGTASTSMAAMFARTVNISPPETRVYYTADDLKPPLDYQGPIVVVWFKMTVGDILNTQFMQVMGVDTAKEEANLILGQLLTDGSGADAQEQEAPFETAAATEPDEELVESLIRDLHGPRPGRPVDETVGARSRDAARPVVPGAGERAGLSLAEGVTGIDQRRLNRILDIPLKVTVLLGRTRWPIKDLLGITPGTIVELQNLVDEPVEVLVNGTPVALGEVVVVNENFGIRITSIMEPEERLKNLRR